MTKDEALNLALQLVSNLRTHSWTVADEQLVITAIKEALAQPWEKFCDSNCVWTDHHPDCKLAERLPLTDEEIRDLWSWSATAEAERTATTQQHAFARAIEAAHGIKGEA